MLQVAPRRLEALVAARREGVAVQQFVPSGFREPLDVLGPGRGAVERRAHELLERVQSRRRVRPPQLDLVGLQFLKRLLRVAVGVVAESR